MKNPLIWFGLGTVGLLIGSTGDLNGSLSYCLQPNAHQKTCVTAPGWFQAPSKATQVQHAGEAPWRLPATLLGVAAFALALRECRTQEEQEADNLMLTSLDKETRLREAEISQQAHLRSYTEVALRMAARRAFETLRMGARMQPVEQATNKTEDVQAQLPAVAVDSSQNAPEPQTADLEEVSPVSTDNPVSVQVDPLGESLVEVLSSFGVKCHLVSAIQGPTFIRVSVKPAPGVAASSIVQRANDLQVQLNFAAVPIVSVQPGCVAIDVPRGDRLTVKFSDYIQPCAGDFNPITLPIGISLQGRLVLADLGDPNTCHFLAGGTSGSGKSEWLRQIVFSLIARYTPAQVLVALVDPKRVTFPEFETMPWLYDVICKEPESAIALMEKLVGEMESRYRLFEKARVKDCQEYNQLGQGVLPRIVCIFDEYADFMADRETKDNLEGSIKRLGAKARAAGVHLILSTQRPDAKDVVTPIIKANLPGRVALKTVDEANSKIVIDEDLAAKLLGKGDLLYRATGPLQRLQALYVSPSEIMSFFANSVHAAEAESPVAISAENTQSALNINKLNELVETSAEKFVAGLDKHYQIILEFTSSKSDWVSASDIRNGRNYMKRFEAAQIQQFFKDLGAWGLGQAEGGKYRYSGTQGT